MNAARLFAAVIALERDLAAADRSRDYYYEGMINTDRVREALDEVRAAATEETTP